MNEDARLENLYDFLECHDPVKYRKKLNGMTLPFGIREKQGRIPKDDPCLKYRYKPDQKSEEIRIKAERARKLREAQKKARQIEEEEKYRRNHEILAKIHEQQLLKKLEQGEISNSKRVLDNMKSCAKPFEGKKITFQILKNLNYKDINLAPEEEFKPEELIGIDPSFNNEEDFIANLKKESKHFSNNPLKNTGILNIFSKILKNRAAYRKINRHSKTKRFLTWNNT